MKHLIFFIVSLSLTHAFSQEKDTLSIDAVKFKAVNEFYIYGDSKVIGNTILSVNKKKDFNGMTAINDDINMKYVDIDNDKSTFSSSAATLALPENYKKISYAGLYWTATYSIEKGVRKKGKRKFIFKGERRKNNIINSIKFKTPNGNYQTVKGTVIFDGLESKMHTLNAPYLCYADITNILNNTTTPIGSYTVANVNASRGYISGGAAAGWMLYVVFETPTTVLKHISTYNGFSLVNKLPINIDFKNYKPADQKTVKTSVVISVLEGDLLMKRDECAIITKNGSFKTLKNKIRGKQNFFNSSITTNAKLNLDRIPASKNTLGFDIAEFDLPSYNYENEGHTNSKTTLQFKTKHDRFYPYFVAFKTEISNDYNNLIINPNITEALVVVENNSPDEKPNETIAQIETIIKPDVIVEPVVIIKPKIIAKPETIVEPEIRENQNENIAQIETIVQPEIVAKPQVLVEPEIKENPVLVEVAKEAPIVPEYKEPYVKPKKNILQQEKKPKVVQPENLLIAVKPTRIKNLESGYYLVTNVFSEKPHAIKWKQILEEKGYKPITFVNPKNNWSYIAVFKTKDLEEALNKKTELIKIEAFKEAWIFKVNLD